MKSGENKGSHWSLCLCVKKRYIWLDGRRKSPGKRLAWKRKRERENLFAYLPPLLKVETVETGKRQKKLGYCPHSLFTKKVKPYFSFLLLSVFASCCGIWEKVGLFCLNNFTRFSPAELIKKGWKKGELSVFYSIFPEFPCGVLNFPKLSKNYSGLWRSFQNKLPPLLLPSRGKKNGEEMGIKSLKCGSTHGTMNK